MGVYRKQLPFKVVRIDGDPVKGHVSIRVVCGALRGWGIVCGSSGGGRLVALTLGRGASYGRRGRRGD